MRLYLRRREFIARTRRRRGVAASGEGAAIPLVGYLIQLAWRFLMFQKDSALAQWFRSRSDNVRSTRKTMIVALARKLLNLSVAARAGWRAAGRRHSASRTLTGGRRRPPTVSAQPCPPTLTAPVRASFALLRVGTKKRDSRSNKTAQESKKERATLKSLDNKNPTQGVQSLL